MPEPRQAGYSSNTALARALLPLDGARAVDIGCGEGKFTRFLAREAAAASRAEGIAVEWLNARAEDLPFAGASFDIVFFTNSLHHVAPGEMDRAIAESVRVLRPGGYLYVMEPVPEGPYFEATRPVNDEREVRLLAQEAIRGGASRELMPVDEVIFLSPRRFASYEDYVAGQAERSEKRALILAELGEKGRAQFEKLARHEEGALHFDQMTRVSLLQRRGPAGAA